MKRRCVSGITFITGTDTGVGKTVFTGHALHYLRQSGVRALAMKLFCSGGREDAQFLSSLQDDDVPLDLMNPFYFARPLAPLMAARMERRRIRLNAAISAIQAQARTCKHLLVEGAGGLLVPLGERFALTDLIRRLNGRVIIVAANRLGVVNHTLLTVAGLRGVTRKRIRIVLMQLERPDVSASGNPLLLREFLPGAEIVSWPFLGAAATTKESVKINSNKMQKTLARFF